jgi:hypothetical protein
MKIRTIALALALTFGLTTVIEAKPKPQNRVKVRKAQKYKAPKSKTAKYKRPKHA